MAGTQHPLRQENQAGRGRDAPRLRWASHCQTLPELAEPGWLDWGSQATFLLPRDPSQDGSQARKAMVSGVEEREGLAF